MRRTFGFAVVFVLLLAAIWVMLPAAKPGPRCLATASVLGTTNDPSGTRQATLVLSNAGNHALYLTPIFGLENRSGKWRTNLIPAKAAVLNTNLMGVLPFHPQAKRLGSGESYVAKLPLPFDDSGWRASFWYIEDRPALTLWDSVFMRGKKHQGGQQIAFTDWTDR